eukprot:Rhum_TRINITY_DN22868_c0_g1::Rhum_TRINITY_DN22868_c0_g1_i1::g.176391::m.176391
MRHRHFTVASQLLDAAAVRLLHALPELRLDLVLNRRVAERRAEIHPHAGPDDRHVEREPDGNVAVAQGVRERQRPDAQRVLQLPAHRADDVVERPDHPVGRVERRLRGGDGALGSVDRALGSVDRPLHRLLHRSQRRVGRLLRRLDGSVLRPARRHRPALPRLLPAAPLLALARVLLVVEVVLQAVHLVLRRADLPRRGRLSVGQVLLGVVQVCLRVVQVLLGVGEFAPRFALERVEERSRVADRLRHNVRLQRAGDGVREPRLARASGGRHGHRHREARAEAVGEAALDLAVRQRDEQRHPLAEDPRRTVDVEVLVGRGQREREARSRAAVGARDLDHRPVDLVGDQRRGDTRRRHPERRLRDPHHRPQAQVQQLHVDPRGDRGADVGDLDDHIVRRVGVERPGHLLQRHVGHHPGHRAQAVVALRDVRDDPLDVQVQHLSLERGVAEVLKVDADGDRPGRPADLHPADQRELRRQQHRRDGHLDAQREQHLHAGDPERPRPRLRRAERQRHRQRPARGEADEAAGREVLRIAALADGEVQHHVEPELGQPRRLQRKGQRHLAQRHLVRSEWDVPRQHHEHVHVRRRHDVRHHRQPSRRPAARLRRLDLRLQPGRGDGLNGRHGAAVGVQEQCQRQPLTQRRPLQLHRRLGDREAQRRRRKRGQRVLHHPRQPRRTLDPVALDRERHPVVPRRSVLLHTDEHREVHPEHLPGRRQRQLAAERHLQRNAVERHLLQPVEQPRRGRAERPAERRRSALERRGEPVGRRRLAAQRTTAQPHVGRLDRQVEPELELEIAQEGALDRHRLHSRGGRADRHRQPGQAERLAEEGDRQLRERPGSRPRLRRPAVARLGERHRHLDGGDAVRQVAEGDHTRPGAVRPDRRRQQRVGVGVRQRRLHRRLAAQRAHRHHRRQPRVRRRRDRSLPAPRAERLVAVPARRQVHRQPRKARGAGSVPAARHRPAQCHRPSALVVRHGRVERKVVSALQAQRRGRLPRRRLHAAVDVLHLQRPGQQRVTGHEDRRQAGRLQRPVGERHRGLRRPAEQVGRRRQRPGPRDRVARRHVALQLDRHARQRQPLEADLRRSALQRVARRADRHRARVVRQRRRERRVGPRQRQRPAARRRGAVLLAADHLDVAGEGDAAAAQRQRPAQRRQAVVLHVRLQHRVRPADRRRPAHGARPRHRRVLPLQPPLQRDRHTRQRQPGGLELREAAGNAPQRQVRVLRRVRRHVHDRRREGGQCRVAVGAGKAERSDARHHTVRHAQRHRSAHSADAHCPLHVERRHPRRSVERHDGRSRGAAAERHPAAHRAAPHRRTLRRLQRHADVLHRHPRHRHRVLRRHVERPLGRRAVRAAPVLLCERAGHRHPGDGRRHRPRVLRGAPLRDVLHVPGNHHPGLRHVHRQRHALQCGVAEIGRRLRRHTAQRARDRRRQRPAPLQRTADVRPRDLRPQPLERQPAHAHVTRRHGAKTQHLRPLLPHRVPAHVEGRRRHLQQRVDARQRHRRRPAERVELARRGCRRNARLVEERQPRLRVRQARRQVQRLKLTQVCDVSVQRRADRPARLLRDGEPDRHPRPRPAADPPAGQLARPRHRPPGASGPRLHLQRHVQQRPLQRHVVQPLLHRRLRRHLQRRRPASARRGRLDRPDADDRRHPVGAPGAEPRAQRQHPRRDAGRAAEALVDPRRKRAVTR